MDMKEHILDIAQRLIQQRGVNGFSYADIAREIGISKASLHHHFATKTDLVARLMERYTDQLTAYLEATDRNANTAIDKLRAYCDLYRMSLDSERICMGGMLSAEAITLDERIHPQLARFFDLQRNWLTRVLDAGRTTAELSSQGSTLQDACTLIAALQGALVLSRAARSTECFDQTAEGLLTRLAAH